MIEIIRDPLRNFSRDATFAGINHPYGFEELFAQHALEQVSLSPGT
ncbi:hypothetical protein GRAN_3579 [Granulicella sibirica]|uniref:Uncharacterized protein n=1 Tax=Granulicella sibirica TaxID=2479048 RepID=A0A4Q0SZG9_9BACT|nr:hypothetical protein GRAN_3579 [Granulicella sibirica]